MRDSLSTVAPPVTAHAYDMAITRLAPWRDEIQRILCVRTDHLGDVLMTTPAFHALRSAWPNRHLTLLTSSSGAALAPFLPDIDEVICYDAPWAGSASSDSQVSPLAISSTLRKGGFDAAVIFTVYSQNPLPAATLCYLAGIPRRLARCRENPYALLNDWVRETEPEQGIQHEVQRQLALVNAVGASTNDTRMRMRVREFDRTNLATTLTRYGIAADTPFIVMHPGASAESRRYPADSFGKAAAQLIHTMQMPVLITGNAVEAEIAQAMMAAAGSTVQPLLHNMTGALELGEFAALIERACIVISNNSGPIHIASALGTPVVDLYALTNPQHGPWKTPHRVLFNDVECRWCYRSICPQGHHACLRGVPYSEVVRETLELIQEASPLGASMGAGVELRPFTIATHTG